MRTLLPLTFLPACSTAARPRFEERADDVNRVFSKTRERQKNYY